VCCVLAAPSSRPGWRPEPSSCRRSVAGRAGASRTRPRLGTQQESIALASGDTKPGLEAARQTLSFYQTDLANRLGHPPTPPATTNAAPRYQVMTTVPENWIPFLPVHVGGDNRTIQLQRAAMPRILDGDPNSPRKVQPRTVLLRNGLDDTPAQPYFVHEEEVPRAGTRLTQAYQRTRWTDGQVYYTWLRCAAKPDAAKDPPYSPSTNSADCPRRRRGIHLRCRGRPDRLRANDRHFGETGDLCSRSGSHARVSRHAQICHQPPAVTPKFLIESGSATARTTREFAIKPPLSSGSKSRTDNGNGVRRVRCPKAASATDGR
jgi:hypothetical protein